MPASASSRGRVSPFSPPATSLWQWIERPRQARSATPTHPCWPRWSPRPAASPGYCLRPKMMRSRSNLRFVQAFSADLLLISGGVSAGKFDLVEPALARLGTRFHFTGVRIQPGKPLVFCEIPRPHAPAAARLRPARQSHLVCGHVPALRRACPGCPGRQTTRNSRAFTRPQSPATSKAGRISPASSPLHPLTLLMAKRSSLRSARKAQAISPPLPAPTASS